MLPAIAILIFVLLLFVIAARIVIEIYRHKNMENVLAELDGEELLRCDSTAHYLGQKSAEWPRPRGPGALALTPTRLYFRLWSPVEEFETPTSAITGIATPMTARSVLKPRRVLYVTFKNQQGEQDAAAWLVRDLAAWQEALIQATGGTAERQRGVDVGWWEPPKP